MPASARRVRITGAPLGRPHRTGGRLTQPRSVPRRYAMLSQQEISDRLEIQELLVRYSHAVDTRDWDAYEGVFTDDAVIDYTEMGGPRGGVKEVRKFLETAMPHFAGFQHMIANTVLEIDGDVARGRTICHNPMVIDKGNGE